MAKTRTPKLLGDFPNTYTFTKSMAERTMMKRRGKTPVVIVRPAIICGSNNEPYPGWSDTLAAAGALTFLFSMGLIHFLEASKDVVADLVPADYVANCIVASTYFGAKKDDLTLVHACTSHYNPVTWYQY